MPPEFPPAAQAPPSAFRPAADAVVRDLHARFGRVVWRVERTDGARPETVATAGSPGSGDAAGAVPAEVVRAPLTGPDGGSLGWLRGWSREPEHPECEGAGAAATLLGRLLGAIAAGERAAAARAAEAATARALATRDALTGLLNRRGWQHALAAEEERARRYGRAVSALVLDLDGLKQLNDTAGHHAGDTALAACADVLTAVCRPGDAVARIGGDEFAVLAVECDAPAARALTDRLRQALRAAGVAATVGAATRRTGEDLTGTVRRADAAMYRGKPRRAPAVAGLPEPRGPRPRRAPAGERAG